MLNMVNGQKAGIRDQGLGAGDSKSESGVGSTGFGWQVLAFDLQLSTLRPLFRIQVQANS